MSANLVQGLDLATGAWGRARFESELAKAVSQAKKTQGPLTLLYVDADDFFEHQEQHGNELQR